MIVTCEECGTRFNLNDDLVKPSGSKVQCSKCAKVFKVYPPSSAPEKSPVEMTHLPSPASGGDAPSKESISHKGGETRLQGHSDAGLSSTGVKPPAEGGKPSSDLESLVSSDSGIPSTDVKFQPPEENQTSALKSSRSDKLELPDLDAMFQSFDEKQAQASSSSQLEDLELPDLDAMFQSSGEKQAQASSSSQLEDLELPDLDAMFQSSGEKQPQASSSSQLEDLELPDLDAMFQSSGEKQPQASASFQLEDLELPDLDAMFQSSGEKQPQASASSRPEDLELPDLDAMFQSSGEKQPQASASFQPEDLELPDLDDMFQSSGEKQASTSGHSLLDELELPDLDTMSQPSDKKQTPSFEPSLLDELDIPDLDIKPQTPKLKPNAAASPHPPEKAEALAEDFDASSDIDISDLLMDTSIDEMSLAASNKLEKTGKRSSDDTKPVDKSLPDAFSDIEALDLSNIESFLEEQEKPVIPKIQKPSDGIPQSKSQPQVASQSDAGYLQEEDHFLSFEELQLDTDITESATISEKKESFKTTPPTVDSPSHETQRSSNIAIPEQSPQNDKPIDNPPGEDNDIEAPEPAPRQGISGSLLILLIIVILGAGGYGLYTLLGSMGIHLTPPSVHKIQDPGNLKITPFDINSKFIDNRHIGKLFIITGKVKNEYPMNRGAIQVTGKLYTKDKKMVKAETVFCGNTLSDIDLTNLDAAGIQKKLQDRMGDNHINVQVKPGDTIPFMIVFTNLPENLDEFTLEVNASTPS